MTDDTSKLPTVPRDAGRLGDRGDRGVDHAVAACRSPRPCRRRGRARRARVGLVAVPPCSSSSWIAVAVHHAGAELLGDDRLEVGLGDLDLLVGELLEAHERVVERVALHVDAHLLERVGERVPARVLAQHDLRGFLTDGRRVDDLVGLAVGEHAVLVDAGLVRERVAADDGLVVLHVVAGEARHQPRRARELLGAHVRRRRPRSSRARVRIAITTSSSAALPARSPEPVDRALDLAGAVGDTGERVRDREAEVVVAVRRDDEVALHVVDARSVMSLP